MGSNCYLYMAIATDQQVVRLQVTVDHIHGMQVLQCKNLYIQTEMRWHGSYLFRHYSVLKKERKKERKKETKKSYYIIDVFR